jgi:ATP-binding protein involved in chromosome partitioning
MSSTTGNDPDPEIALRRAIDAADVPAPGTTDATLGTIGAVGEVGVDGGVATVTLRLPVPAEESRERIESALAEVLGPVEGVADVAVKWKPAVGDPGAHVEYVPEVKNVIAVSSGKGGVGKSTVAANLAVALADAGSDVGILDADVYGPNLPAMFGMSDATPRAPSADQIVPREAHAVSVMSMDFIAGEDDPVIWRGPKVDDALQQFFGDVAWGALDYLVVDLPPGTGDAQLSLVQHLPVTGAVVVTTPQAVATDDARKGLRMFDRYDVPVLGLVENMSGFACPDCGSAHDVFGTGGGDSLAAEFDVPVLGRVPLDPAVSEMEASMDDDDPPGVDLPFVGRVGLPRTAEEREPTRLPPVVLREAGEPGASPAAPESDEGPTSSPREALRMAATSAAVRVEQLIADAE